MRVVCGWLIWFGFSGIRVLAFPEVLRFLWGWYNILLWCDCCVVV